MDTECTRTLVFYLVKCTEYQIAYRASGYNLFSQASYLIVSNPLMKSDNRCGPNEQAKVLSA